MLVFLCYNNLGDNMKKIYVIVFLLISILLVGCANDASEDEKQELLELLEDNGYIEKGLEYVGKSYIETPGVDGTNHVGYDVYSKNDKYYAFNFDKIYVKPDGQDCNFVVYIYDQVKKVTDNTYPHYNPDTHEYDTKFTVVYETNTNVYDKYCITKSSKFFGLIKSNKVSKMN